MQRITMTIGEEELALLDGFVARKGYASRSEALRDILRTVSAGEEAAEDGAPCIATLSYVYEHRTRDLARRLTDAQHAQHDLSVSTLHVHLDRGDCLEVTVLKGGVGAVRAFADAVVTQRGVRMGHLHVIPLAAGQGHHAHAHAQPRPAKTG